MGAASRQPSAGVSASGASYSVPPPGAATRHRTVQPAGSAPAAADSFSRGASVPVQLSCSSPARSHRSSMCTAGLAYKNTGRKMPKKRKKS